MAIRLSLKHGICCKAKPHSTLTPFRVHGHTVRGQWYRKVIDLQATKC